MLNDVKASVYKDFCVHREKKLDACLVSDLKVCNFSKLKIVISQTIVKIVICFNLLYISFY